MHDIAYLGSSEKQSSCLAWKSGVTLYSNFECDIPYFGSLENWASCSVFLATVRMKSVSKWAHSFRMCFLACSWFPALPTPTEAVRPTTFTINKSTHLFSIFFCWSRITKKKEANKQKKKTKKEKRTQPETAQWKKKKTTLLQGHPDESQLWWNTILIKDHCDGRKGRRE